MRVAIIGSRDTSGSLLTLIEVWAEELALSGIEISTGGADGADSAAMRGAIKADPNLLWTYLPWRSFRRGQLPQPLKNIVVYNSKIHHDWTQSVVDYHPNSRRLSDAATSLHARNYGIVNDVRVDAVIANPRSKYSLGLGGTGQGMRVAEGLGIRLYDLSKTNVVSEVDEWVQKITSGRV